jgi:lipid-A-disaccharide synthase-like uncharacterized protein
VRIGKEVQEVLRQVTVTLLVLGATSSLVPAAVASAVQPRGAFLSDLLKQLTDPLFWFGMVAQGLFFTRFIIQWLVSEKRKRSTIPTVFWYISLAGGASWFIYGVLRRDLAIMAGALVSSGIYIRNLMLIHGRAKRQRLAGSPVAELRSEADGDLDSDDGV